MLKLVGKFICICALVSNLYSSNSVKPWTFLVYMARDNSLSDFGTVNINELKSISNPNVNILVVDSHNLNGVKETQKLLITHDSVKVLETIPNLDSGNIENFTQACLWAVNDFPSEKLA